MDTKQVILELRTQKGMSQDELAEKVFVSRQTVVEIKNDLIRTMGECRDVTDQYQTERSAYLRLGQLFMRLFAGLL
ncbi:helix-turn-helix domain-containing protein [Ruminococcus sp. FMB-CY1]|uniref:helix-turn-helix domain-containing protein n=1 Tax=unclassified Ruminococcus TaxID=2608920 RepID=UPI0025ACFC85|nr:helix-turn-helix domain-containing protein [Ruminococcus sp. FMBCY1]WBX58023.1 helix-turn-helix domain-containing protein [Ruminococcus sp. FMB-CY1]